MTILEKFVAFAEGLPAERRSEIEELLSEIMADDGTAVDFTVDELAELERRMADPNPKYADPKDIAAIFGTTFGA